MFVIVSILRVTTFAGEFRSRSLSITSLIHYECDPTQVIPIRKKLLGSDQVHRAFQAQQPEPCFAY